MVGERHSDVLRTSRKPAGHDDLDWKGEEDGVGMSVCLYRLSLISLTDQRRGNPWFREEWSSAVVAKAPTYNGL